MSPEPRKEHNWLQKMVGEWAYEVEASMQPGQPPVKMKGEETVRSLGKLWILAEGRGEGPDGCPGTTITTLGFDPERGRYVGTFVASVMDRMWHYDGQLDAAERVLTLDTEGPDMSKPGKIAKYQDIIEFHADNHRTLTSRMLGEDGAWHEFMKAHYHRK